MLLQEFTGFDDVIIVFVTSQPQNMYFQKFNQKKLQQAKNLLLSLTNRCLDRGKNLPRPLPVQIGYKNSPVDIGLNKKITKLTKRSLSSKNISYKNAKTLLCLTSKNVQRKSVFWGHNTARLLIGLSKK